jgi:thiamine pyrophosphate-dependent acetolactate synthase large subunit-like protein
MGDLAGGEGAPRRRRPRSRGVGPIKHVLLDSHALGKIAKEQRAEESRFTGIRVERRDQLAAAMTNLFAGDAPALLAVEQDPELL